MLNQELIIVRQKYTPYGGGERFLAQAIQQMADDGLRIRILCRDWQGDVPYEVTRLPISALTRTQRDKSFARLACTHIHASPNALVQSHERIACCDIYRAGEGLHKVWLEQRQHVRSSWSGLVNKLSPYHHYTLNAEKRLFNSRRLRAVICNSHMVKNEIQQHYGVDGQKLHVVYNGVDQDYFHPDRCVKLRPGMRAQLGLHDDSMAYLFVGSGYERKGLGSLLQAFTQLNDNSQLLVVGQDKKQDCYQQLAQTLGIADQVHFLGAQKDIRPYYAAADVLALPTLYDPFPNVVLEAMACGLPVITSTKCGATDIIRHLENGWLLDALDIEGLHQAMLESQQTETAQAIGSAGRQSIALFTFEAMSQHYQQLYQTLAQH